MKKGAHYNPKQDLAGNEESVCLETPYNQEVKWRNAEESAIGHKPDSGSHRKFALRNSRLVTVQKRLTVAGEALTVAGESLTVAGESLTVAGESLTVA
jgi:hypothetical protein